MTARVKQLGNFKIPGTIGFRNRNAYFSLMVRTLVISLVELANQKVISEEGKQLIDTWLEENDLLDEQRVPEWFIHLLVAITERRETDKTYYKTAETDGDVFNLLAELSEILVAEWDDYGEGIEIYFPHLDLNVFISRESDFYRVFR